MQSKTDLFSAGRLLTAPDRALSVWGGMLPLKEASHVSVSHKQWKQIFSAMEIQGHEKDDKQL